MATPLGHAFAAYGVWQLSPPRDRRREAAGIAVCTLLALAPDFDFLPGLLVGKPGLYHQGISHSLGFLLLAGLLGALIFPWVAPTFVRRLGLLGLPYGSHLAMDLFGPDRRPPIGIPVLWPLSSEPFLSPWPLLMGVHHSSRSVTRTPEWLDNVLSLHNALAVGVELLVVAPFVLLALWYRRRRAGTPP